MILAEPGDQRIDRSRKVQETTAIKSGSRFATGGLSSTGRRDVEHPSRMPNGAGFASNRESRKLRVESAEFGAVRQRQVADSNIIQRQAVVGNLLLPVIRNSPHSELRRFAKLSTMRTATSRK